MRQCFAQNYADKEYYLVDSLDLDELADPDIELLNSSLKLYHSSTEDTLKIQAINTICENMMHDDWIKYNQWIYNSTEKKIAENPSSLSLIHISEPTRPY